MNYKEELPKNVVEVLESIIKTNIQRSLVPGKDLIPAAAPTLSSDDIFGGISSLLNGWLTDGSNCNKFEKGLKKYFSSSAAILTNSGSSANLLSISALTSPLLGSKALQKGDEIITVAAGFPTTINPIVQNGMIPVFIDIEIPSFNINVAKMKAAISPKTKAIILAHSLGNPFNIKVVSEFAKEHNLWLIEDNCDAFGAEYDGKKTGTFGDLSTLSFFPAHQITTGEGGAIIVNNNRLTKIIESFKNWGRDCWCIPGDDDTCGTRFLKQYGDLPKSYDHKYVFTHLGYNLKMTETQAAIGLSQLTKINNFVDARRQNHAYLNSLFQDLDEFFILPEFEKEANPSWFGYLLTCKEGVDRVALLNELSDKKVGVRLFFAGNITKQPAYKNVEYRIHGNLNNTDQVMSDSFWLGVWPGLDKTHFDYMYTVIKQYLTN